MISGIIIDCSQPSIFSYFYLIVLLSLIEPRENWTQAQNGRLDWVGGGTEKNTGAVDIFGKK